MFAHLPILRDIIYGASSRGADFNALCKLSGINPKDLTDSDKKLDWVPAYRVWENAVKLTGDKMLGLHIGESANPTILGLVGHLMQSSRTLGEAFENVSRYGELATDMFRYEIRNATLLFKPSELWVKQSPDSARQAVEQAMAGTLNVFKMLSGQRVFPTEVYFRHSRKGPQVEYESVFQCMIKFNAPSSCMIFEKSELSRKVLSYDQSVCQLLESALREKINRLKQSEKFSEQVRKIILSEFKGQVPPLEILASRANLTVRTAQRKLDSEKTSYRKLTGQIQSDLAKQMIGQKIKVSEVASVLGYSQASAFRRAYKKWTRHSPKGKD